MERLRWLAAPPIFKDEDKTRIARLLHIITTSIIVLILIYVVTIIITRDWRGLNYAVAVVLLAVFVNFVSRRGFVRAASLFFCSTMWLVFVWPLMNQGVFHVSFTALLIPVL